MNVHRMLVTGSRKFTGARSLRLALSFIWECALDGGPLVVVHGACPSGADALASAWVRSQDVSLVTEERHPADWVRYGKAAGPIRNKAMVSRDADVCLAFFQLGAENKGTQGCVDLAEAAGIPVLRLC